jgi:hypothetical protein
MAINPSTPTSELESRRRQLTRAWTRANGTRKAAIKAGIDEIARILEQREASWRAAVAQYRTSH